MDCSVYDLREFYATRAGRIVRHVVRRAIRDVWPDVKGLRVLGCGYAVPYLSLFSGESERTLAVMPARQGAQLWPPGEKNIVALAEESELPFETNSIDRILLIHDLEYSELLHPGLEEIWRVLKSDGRVLAVVPNRLGLWARSERTPFGHGKPFTAGQLCNALREALFVVERSTHALFVPPFAPLLFPRTAVGIEQVGPYLYPALAGLHLVEAVKRIYGTTGLREPSKARIRGRTALLPRPVGTG